MILHSSTAQSVVISTTPQPDSEAVRRFTIPLAPDTSPESGARPAFIMSLDRWTLTAALAPAQIYLLRRGTDSATHLLIQGRTQDFLKGGRNFSHV